MYYNYKLASVRIKCSIEFDQFLLSFFLKVYTLLSQDHGQHACEEIMGQ